MVQEEVQIIKQGGVFKKRTYTYADGPNPGHPLSEVVIDATQAEIDTFLDTIKPETISINPLDILSKNLFDQRGVLQSWLKYSAGSNYIWINNIVSRPIVTVDHTQIGQIETIIEEDKRDIDNPLTDTVADQLLLLFADLKSKIKNP